MKPRNIGLTLLVVLVGLVVAVGAVTAHGPADSTDGAANASGTWWMGDHMGAGGSYWMGDHMGPYQGWTGPGDSDLGSGYGYACAGPWNTGTMGVASGWGMGGSGLWGLGLLWPLLLVGLVVVAGYVVVTRSRGSDGGDRALALLRERYASGELSEEEYTSRRETLRP